MEGASIFTYIMICFNFKLSFNSINKVHVYIYEKQKKYKNSKKTFKNKIKNTCIKSTIIVGKVRGQKGWLYGRRRPIQMSELYAQNTNMLVGENLILVREKFWNCQGNLLCSNCGHPVRQTTGTPIMTITSLSQCHY